jgi:hypothetical protein
MSLLRPRDYQKMYGISSLILNSIELEILPKKENEITLMRVEAYCSHPYYYFLFTNLQRY